MRGGTQRAARRGDLKIVSDATHTFLFDVRRDPGERRDLARRQPHDVRALSLLLAAWEQSVDAEAARRRKPDAAASSASASAAASWPRISAPW
jgi:arylsulfatase A-like enzyme